jgi:SAM-dependent methyltransferase
MPHLHWHPPTDVPTEPPFEMNAPTHRSRVALERVLAHPDDDGAWGFLAHTYDEMAAEWPEWATSQHWYNSPVRSGLSHAKPVPWALEVGCGTGQATAPLTGFTRRIVATDVNQSMLALAPRLPEVGYVVCDVRALPVPDRSVPLLVGLNAIPHIREFTRVIAVGGQLLWCTSFSAGTPLYVEPERLLELLGPGWRGEAGRAGHGDWALLSRTG